MKTTHQVHNLIILDESGSMNAIRSSIVQGFNELVQSIKGIESQFPEQEHFISFISFNSFGNKIHHFIDPVKMLNKIDDRNYRPNGMTPLYDAMGNGINKLRYHLNGITDHNVLVTILTDGEENCSREYSGASIKDLVNELKENRWTFTYVGTDHDVDKIASSLSIDNTLVFDKSASGIKDMFEKERQAREAYYQKVRFKEDAKSDYFSKFSKD